MKKRVIRVLFCCMLLLILTSPASALGATVIGDNVTAQAGDVIEYSVDITGNTGFAGFVIFIKCDTDVFSIVEEKSELSFSAGDALSGGTLIAAPNGNDGWEVLYFKASNTKKDDTLFTVKMRVSPNAQSGTYPVEIAYSVEDTVTQDGMPVPLTTIDGSICINGNDEGPRQSDEPALEGTAAEHQNAPQIPRAAAEAVFRDVPQTHWAYECIHKLAQQGIVSGVGGDAFAPDSKVTRAQFVKMLAGVMGAEVKNPKTDFADVSVDSWYAPHVAWAKENGIVNGISDTLFAPDSNITREQICAILNRCSEKYSRVLPRNAQPIHFSDASSISDYAQESVKALQEAGIISGYENGTFRPKNNATRAESAKILSMFMELKEG